MKCYISVVCVLSAFVAVSLAAPTTLEDTGIVPVHNQVKRQADNSEVLNRVISYSNQKLQQLRMLCPQLFQVIDAVIQNVTSQVFRVVGGALLRSGGLGGGGSSGGSSGGGRVSVVLPTFPPDEDDDDEDDDDDDAEKDVDLRSRSGDSNSTSSSTSSSAVALSADIFNSTESNEIGGDDDRSKASSSSTTTITTVTSTTDSESTTVSPTTAPFTSPSLAQDSIAKRHIRIARDIDDQETSASGGNGPDPASDLSNVDADDADRNKRYLPFGGDGAAGGSGNFLFDLIRLVAGSGGNEESDEKAAGVGGVAEVDIAPKSTEGIPGPITRLLVIANRGIANLIQDLILRLAQTSERIVNFKARLVTALI